MVAALPPVTLLITDDLSSRRLTTLGRAAFVEHRSRGRESSSITWPGVSLPVRSQNSVGSNLIAGQRSTRRLSGADILLENEESSSGSPFFFNSRSFVDRHLSLPFETRRLERPLRTSSGSRQTGLSVLSLAPWSLGVGCNKGGTRGRSNLEKGRPDFWSGAGEREKDKSLDALNTGGGNWISVIMCIYDGLLPSAMLWERRRERMYDMFIYVVRRGK